MVKTLKIHNIKKQRNELLKRNDVQFIVIHKAEGTPSRMETRNNLAVKLDVDNDLVYLTKLESKKGSMITEGAAKVYDTVAQATFIEPEYIRLRNTPKSEKKE